MKYPDRMKFWKTKTDGQPGCTLHCHNESTLKRENYEIIDEQSTQHTCYHNTAAQDHLETPQQDQGPASEQDQAATSEELVLTDQDQSIFYF